MKPYYKAKISFFFAFFLIFISIERSEAWMSNGIFWNKNLHLLAGAVGGAGFADGNKTLARLNNPYAAVLDSSGNIFVLDTSNHLIRKSTGGVVSTFVGVAGSSGSTNGTGTAAKLGNPYGMTIDSSDNIYFSESFYHTIRKITSGGVVSTFAGTSSSSGSVDATGTAAKFKNPSGLTIDSSGNIYVADSGNHTIRIITSGGVVTTLAGTAGTSGSTDATGTAASFNSPNGVAVDSSGNVYVTDTYNYTIRKITSAGVVTTFAGTVGSSGSANGTGTAAKFNAPFGIAIDSSGNLFVADTNNSVIRKITTAGVVTTFAGTAGSTGYIDGTGAAARFISPQGIFIDGSNNLYVSDSSGNTIRKITSAAVVTTVAGTASTIGYTDATGSLARLNEPSQLAVDSSGNVYVATYSSIRKITRSGVASTFAGSNAGTMGTVNATGTAARFSYPRGVAVDSSGNLFVADSSSSIIRKVTSAGVATTLAGSGSTGSTDATGTAASFNYPTAIAVDSTSGNIYVADSNNSIIRKITSAGVVTTLAGTAGVVGSTDATGASASFSGSIAGLAVDSSGNIFLADAFNSKIRKITSAGVVTTYAGTGAAGYVEGNAASAKFNTPKGIAVDSLGNVYVADTGNNVIRKINTSGVVSTVVGKFGLSSVKLGALKGIINAPISVAVYRDRLYITTENEVLWCPKP